MSVKPIQDDLQVSEVGETPKVNKTNIDSQLLPLPPMTMGAFQDLVQSVVEDITKPVAPQTIAVDELVAPTTSSETPETPTTSSETQSPVIIETPQVPTSDLEKKFSNIDDLETRVLDLLSQLEGRSMGSGASQDASGLTTREYVDVVLDGERNLEGEKLVDVANFLSNKGEEGLRFQRNEEGTIDVFQGNELINTMDETQVNAWITEFEKAEASRNDEASDAVTKEHSANTPDVEGKILHSQDISTSEHKPFSFDGEALLFLNDTGSSVQKIDLFDEIAKSHKTNGKKDYYVMKFTIDTSGNITDSELVFENKNGKDTIPIGLEELVEFELVGGKNVQTKIYFPFAIAFNGQLQMLSTGGLYKLFTYCVNIDGDKLDAFFPHKLI